MPPTAEWSSRSANRNRQTSARLCRFTQHLMCHAGAALAEHAIKKCCWYGLACKKSALAPHAMKDRVARTGVRMRRGGLPGAHEGHAGGAGAAEDLICPRWVERAKESGVDLEMGLGDVVVDGGHVLRQVGPQEVQGWLHEIVEQALTTRRTSDGQSTMQCFHCPEPRNPLAGMQ